MPNRSLCNKFIVENYLKRWPIFLSSFIMLVLIFLVQKVLFKNISVLLLYFFQASFFCIINLLQSPILLFFISFLSIVHRTFETFRNSFYFLFQTDSVFVKVNFVLSSKEYIYLAERNSYLSFIYMNFILSSRQWRRYNQKVIKKIKK